MISVHHYLKSSVNDPHILVHSILFYFKIYLFPLLIPDVDVEYLVKIFSRTKKMPCGKFGLSRFSRFSFVFFQKVYSSGHFDESSK